MEMKERKSIYRNGDLKWGWSSLEYNQQEGNNLCITQKPLRNIQKKRDKDRVVNAKIEILYPYLFLYLYLISESISYLYLISIWYPYLSLSIEVPMLEFLLLFGLTITTSLKKTLNWQYISDISFPLFERYQQNQQISSLKRIQTNLNTFATKVPPGRRTCVVIFKA